DKDHVFVRRKGLAVEEYLIVEGIVETQSEVGLQGRVGLAQAVERGDLGNDVAGRIVPANPYLILLRVEIFLPARQRRRLAQLEAGIHAPQPGERRRQRGANEEPGASRGLQEEGVDVRRVDEKMRAEIVLDVARRKLGEIVDQLLFAVAPGEVGV